MAGDKIADIHRAPPFRLQFHDGELSAFARGDVDCLARDLDNRAGDSGRPVSIAVLTFRNAARVTSPRVKQSRLVMLPTPCLLLFQPDTELALSML